MQEVKIKDSGILLIAFWLSLIFVQLGLINAKLYSNTANAQTTLSAKVMPNLCNSNLDVIRECCK
jgi:hypothetical protein